VKWEKVKLGEVLDNIVGGGTPSKLNLNYWSGNIYWCSVKDMSFDTHYLSSTKDTITEEGLKNSTSNLIKQGTVITATRMGLGRAFINKVDMAINQDLKALIPNKKIDNLFLLWTIIYKREEILSMGRGATVNGITLDMLTDIQITLPPLDIQRKIANTMSMYDDLIENNQKQIKLLEEAAQRLYKEWFVDFRFPGYENAKFIDGIPEGWRKYKIDDIFKIKYGKTLSTSKINKIGKYPVYGANGVIGYYNEKNCNDYVVLITSRGNGSGDVSRTHDKESFVTNNSFLVNPFNINYRLSYVHQLIKTINFKNICTGSAQPQLTNNSISMLSAVVASDELVGRFCDVGDLLYEKIDNILKQNILLTQARDRLLPKLMSGEIEV
jgi:restriction modification system DNA specificity domain protein